MGSQRTVNALLLLSIEGPILSDFYCPKTGQQPTPFADKNVRQKTPAH